MTVYYRLVFCIFDKNPVQENPKLSSQFFRKTQFWAGNSVPLMLITVKKCKTGLLIAKKLENSVPKMEKLSSKMGKLSFSEICRA